MHRSMIAMLCLLIQSALSADTLTTKSGNSYECVVLAETATAYTIRRGYGVLDMPKSVVASVQKTPVVTSTAILTKPPTKKSNITRGSAGRFPAWAAVVDYVTKEPWGKDLRQIPATYVDNGVQKDVPYQSFQCSGGEYEVNIYGDPDDPACIELGAYNAHSTDAKSQDMLIAAMATLVPDQVDEEIIRAANRKKDLIRRDGWTVEITPPDAPDAYGGWWVSIYDEAKLDKARATQAELAQVTVAKPSATPTAPNPTAVKSAPPPPAPAPLPPVASADSDDWSKEDFARRSAKASSESGTSGRVYVRGYFRKNGTYVSPHTRRR